MFSTSITRAFGLTTPIVNAGMANDPDETIGEVSTDCFVRLMLTNTLAPMRAIEALQSLVPPEGTIGVMSSELGSVADNEKGGWEAYRASKAALNQLMRSFAARHADDPHTLLLIAPGWVQTSLGGPGAPLTIDQSIPGVVDTGFFLGTAERVLVAEAETVRVLRRAGDPGRA